MRRPLALVVMGAVLFPALALAGEARLFVDGGAQMDLARPPSLGVVRARTARFNPLALPGADGRSLPPPAGHTIVLNLFDDVDLRARLVRAEAIPKGMTWTGKVEGQPLSDVVLAVYDGVLTGSVTWPEASYRITVEGGLTVVQQLDHSQFPEDGCFQEVPGGVPDMGEPVAQGDDGSSVDVLVVYTPAARAAAGGTSAMLSHINLGIAETNTGYANSGVVQRVRLANAAEVSYTEAGTTTSGMITDLNRVTNTSDGFLDSVHTLRNTYNADVVSLWETGYNNPSGACGIAWLMPGNLPSFASNAFSVVDISCATGYYSFGHEMGHNMGLNHARVDYATPPTGAYPYSFGYKWTGYRTVMAYAPGTRILHFSNPNVSYLGNATGVNEAAGNSANNALSLNNTRVTVANWRVAPRTQSAWHGFFAVNTLETPYVGDFNGDGRTDIITFTRQNPSAVGDVYVALSNGSQFGANTKWNDWFAITTDETVVIGDYDGDGKDDIATWLGKTTRQIYAARSLGTGMAPASLWLSSIGFTSTDVPLSGDANGDGKDDIILFARTQGRVYVALSNGTTFAPPTQWHSFFAVSTYERPRVADVTGDGKADIVTFATDSPTAYGDVYVATSDGTKFVDLNGIANSSSKWHDWFAISPSEQVRVGDRNDDGKGDFFTFLPLPWGQCYTVLSQGTSMAPNVLWPEQVVFDSRDIPFAGDANGDGKADVIIFAQGEGKVYVSLAN